MKQLILLTSFIPFFVSAQTKGVPFETGKSWGAILAEAKAENKYIFLDCYATWCGPCKLMDRNVYKSDTAALTLEDKFICVKVQMDSTASDPESVRQWYEEARSLQIKYKITAFPSFLFFSPDGEIVHRDAGYKGLGNFSEMIRTALDPAKQYCTLLERYKTGPKDYTVIPYLYNLSKQINDPATADLLAHDYIDHYLLALKGDQVYQKNGLILLANYVKNMADSGFDLFYRHGGQVDSAVGRRGYSQVMVEYVAYVQFIKPIEDSTKGGFEPDWDRCEELIRDQLGGANAANTVLLAKVRWYKNHQQWPQYIKYLIAKVETYGVDGGFGIAWNLNNAAWDIFLHSNDRKQLEKALSFSDSTIKSKKPLGIYFDTYANLLYKTGNVKEALVMEQKAMLLSPKNTGFRTTYSEMLNGQETWLTK